jgi:hypothetical protein
MLIIKIKKFLLKYYKIDKNFNINVMITQNFKIK